MKSVTEFTIRAGRSWKRLVVRNDVLNLATTAASNTTSNPHKSSKSSLSWKLQVPLKHINHLINPFASDLTMCIIQMFWTHHRSSLTFPLHVGERNSGVMGKSARWELHLPQDFITSKQMSLLFYLFTFTRRDMRFNPQSIILSVLWRKWRSFENRYHHHHHHQWLYSPLLGPGLFLSFVIFFTDGRTPWTRDRLVARPLPTHRTTQTLNKRTHRHPYFKWDSNPRSQLSSDRRQFMPHTARSLWSASIGTGRSTFTDAMS
jgi:hypothetical protein